MGSLRARPCHVVILHALLLPCGAQLRANVLQFTSSPAYVQGLPDASLKNKLAVVVTRLVQVDYPARWSACREGEETSRER